MLWRVQLCGLLPQLPVGLRRVASLLALAVGRKASEARCSSPVLLVEVLNGTKSFGDGPLTQWDRDREYRGELR